MPSPKTVPAAPLGASTQAATPAGQAAGARGAAARPVPPVKIGLFKAFYNFARDPKASTAGKLFLLGVLVYVVSPIDLIPDLAPIIGWLDDIGLAAVAVWYLSSALEPYRDGSATKEIPGATTTTGQTDTNRQLPR